MFFLNCYFRQQFFSSKFCMVIKCVQNAQLSFINLGVMKWKKGGSMHLPEFLI